MLGTYFCFAGGIERSAGAEYWRSWKTAENARFAAEVLGAMLVIMVGSDPEDSCVDLQWLQSAQEGCRGERRYEQANADSPRGDAL